MYKLENDKQPDIKDFYLPFGGKLNEENRWVIMSKKIPWKEIEKDYMKSFSDLDIGAPAKSVRMALGALIIKERLNITDREVVDQIRETPYLQYFIGLEGFQDEVPFDASMMVHFRKRFSDNAIGKVNELLIKIHKEEELKKKKTKQNRLKRQRRKIKGN
jgi:hypothetical protein